MKRTPTKRSLEPEAEEGSDRRSDGGPTQGTVTTRVQGAKGIFLFNVANPEKERVNDYMRKSGDGTKFVNVTEGERELNSGLN